MSYHLSQAKQYWVLVERITFSQTGYEPQSCPVFSLINSLPQDFIPSSLNIGAEKSYAARVQVALW